ncbi:MAG: magnesium/cobalt transporter CorA [Candidatus Woesearchaeota archaeon]|nr:MAG: magnesium/cobalt transporter CorA [Candidatus Woesearchaeota archaeon]
MIEIYYNENGIQKASLEELDKLRSKKKWVQITNITPDEKEIVQKEFNLHPLTSEDLGTEGTRIKVEEFPEYLFSVFYGIAKSKTVGLVELDFILGNNMLITSNKIPRESYEKIKQDPKKLESLFDKGLDFLFHYLLDQEVDNFFPVLENIDDEIEELEDEAAKRPRPELLTKIHKLKRKIITIKKISLPQREKISFLAKNNYDHISKKTIPYFRDVYDHSIRVADTLDNYREAIGATADAYMTAVSNNMNEVMKVLSIIATIALPLTVISGIYGTNFDVLPGQHLAFGFWFMIFLMLLVAGLMVYMFKKRNWF